VATIAIKGKTSSSKSLFPKLSKHACFMAKEGRKKVKSNTPSSPKYVTSDEDTFLVIIMILVIMITFFQMNL
jgi:hypothetical protein